MRQMIGHEGLDKPIPVIKARMAPKAQCLPGYPRRLLQAFGYQLLGQPRIGLALVDQNFRRMHGAPHQRAGIPLLPERFIGAEVMRERLAAPWYGRWMRNRREC